MRIDGSLPPYKGGSWREVFHWKTSPYPSLLLDLMKLFSLFLLLFFSFIPILSAQTNPMGFKTPSGNITCVQWKEGSGIRCDLATIEKSSIPKPKDCYQVWGQAYALEPTGRGRAGCVGDSIASAVEVSTLPYGQTWQKDGFTCVADETQLRCTNAEGHGFSLSKKKQSLF